MGKKLFGNVRTQLVGTLVATVGGIALAACSSCNSPCNTCTPVYKKPCCAQSGGGMASCGAKPAPMAAPQAKPAGGQMACGTGKCG
jgi:hypothetical protein